VSAELSRRQWLAAIPAAVGTAAIANRSEAAPRGNAPEPFVYCLNTSTISGQKLPISEVVAIAGKAGYRAIEPWIRELEAHKSAGKSLNDLKKQIDDADLSVESAIGFAEWAVDDEARRKKGLEQMKREMAMVRAIGGKRIAAAPVGLTDHHEPDIQKLGERYRALCELGDAAGVVAQAELWGFSKTMGRLGEVAGVVIESGHPKACLLPDVFHLYKGGSSLEGFRLLSPESFSVIHMNDYPANPPRASITDAQRVYPGDGVAPITPMLRDFMARGFRVALSLEVFNRDYWKLDAAEVAATGLAKMKACVAKALLQT
jgi:2-keto-myo-inositol isomerase